MVPVRSAFQLNAGPPLGAAPVCWPLSKTPLGVVVALSPLVTVCSPLVHTHTTWSPGLMLAARGVNAKLATFTCTWPARAASGVSTRAGGTRQAARSVAVRMGLSLSSCRRMGRPRDARGARTAHDPVGRGPLTGGPTPFGCGEQVAGAAGEVREARLEVEQLALAREAAAVAGEAAVGAHDAVAGHDDDDGVLVVGEPHRARGLRLADGLRDLPVGAHLAVGDRAQRLPHLELEVRAGQVQRQAELHPGAAEVVLELLRHRLQLEQRGLPR